MLREVGNTRQHPGERRRRWFCCAEQDLYLWQDETGEIVAFQLCYAKPDNEHAIYWRADSGFSHLRVDDGESTTFSASTPVLVADGVFDSRSVVDRFRALAAALPADVVEFVIARLGGR